MKTILKTILMTLLLSLSIFCCMFAHACTPEEESRRTLEEINEERTAAGVCPICGEGGHVNGIENPKRLFKCPNCSTILTYP